MLNLWFANVLGVVFQLRMNITKFYFARLLTILHHHIMLVTSV